MKDESKKLEENKVEEDESLEEQDEINFEQLEFII
jgi:hypothetical protein